MSVGSVVFLVVAAAVIGRLLSPEKSVQRAATRPLAPENPGLPAPATPAKPVNPGEVDLLSLIRFEENVISGSWKKSNEGALISPAEPEARVQIPYIPPEEYDLRAVVVRKSSDFRSFHIGLVAGGHQFLVSLDGYGGRSFLEYLDGKVSEAPGTVYHGWALKDRRPLTIVCYVRRSHLTVSVEGGTVIDWEGDFKRLTLPYHWRIEDDQALLVGVFKSRYEIHEITLTPVTGTGRVIR
jgi:hypothetical protein